MIIETSPKNQYSYFYMLNSFLKGKKKCAQLLNATHLLVTVVQILYVFSLPESLYYFEFPTNANEYFPH